MSDAHLPNGHLVAREGLSPSHHGVPTPEQLAEQASDTSTGDAISDQPFSDEAHHEAAFEASGWDEETDD